MPPALTRDAVDADFPAAHSMDTDWFAVDRDGRVALFDSGENGAVADGSARLDHGLSLDQFAPHAPGSVAVDDVDGLYATASPGHEFEYPRGQGRLVTFVRSLDAVADSLASGDAVALAGGKRPAVAWVREGRDALDRLHRARECRRCLLVEHAARTSDGREPGDVGVYRYAHAPDAGTPQPYTRVQRPSRPLHLDALPAPLRAKVGAVRFADVSFEADARVQPFEHAPSHAYKASGWCGTDGEVHAVPGREAEFAREYGVGAGDVLFYAVGDEYGCFSNFYPAPVRLKGRAWPTTEHYFQAQKFAGTKHEEAVRAAKTPMLAARMGRDRSLPLRRDWEAVKDAVMRDAVRAKFEQHADLREVLLATGDARLVEHTENDSYWGDGGDGSGRNRLGEILMEVRAALRAGSGQ